MTNYKAEIDQLLTERRPDRYEVEGGDEWLDLIAAEVANSIPMAEARALAARQLVRNRETSKLRAANRIIREIGITRQIPIDWLETMHLPMSVGKERVSLRAAVPDDFRRFATEERRRAASDFTSRNQTCEAAEFIADHMVATGARSGRELTFEGQADAA